MRYAFTVLKLSPDTFWSLSLDEFAAMLPADAAIEPLSRAAYNHMKHEMPS